MNWAIDSGWQVVLLCLVVVLLVSVVVATLKVNKLTAATRKTSAVIHDMKNLNSRLTQGLIKLERAVDCMGVSNMPRDGFPQQMEACWEDVGARGRFLTDLGGMSIKMREQQSQEFFKALNKPILCTPAAGSMMDILLDLDEYLTQQIIEQEDEWVLVRKKDRKAH